MVHDSTVTDKDQWALTTIGAALAPDAPLDVTPIQTQPLRCYSLQKVCQQMPSVVALRQEHRSAGDIPLVSTFTPFSTMSNLKIVCLLGDYGVNLHATNDRKELLKLWTF